MKIAVWDTYVNRMDGLSMHFDILVPDHITDENKILAYGRKYLDTKTFKTGKLTSNECKFCHIQKAPNGMIEDIEANGYSIFEMENCN
ncbi:DUF2024 family protein [Aquimarina litoralis]|uniref:DUF2024 family protein n=1 Tax=Aquimarina litoralis TaxID=584605 RepID=UPI001C55C825|nr:DUF2024 family protein [Aquimarina litoralis]MBW1298817.1 DUF2024 family protein [Aquimarina litoralis]